jgi:hypothetical protein
VVDVVVVEVEVVEIEIPVVKFVNSAVAVVICDANVSDIEAFAAV